MQLYHGSSRIVEQPFFGGGRTNNDYGPGFYCTKDANMAKEWAVKLGKDGFINEYDVDTTGLSILHLNSDEGFCTLHWLGVLLENREFALNTPLAVAAKDYILRTFAVSYASHDIIIGYRADDSYFQFAKAFLAGTISYEQLSRAMKLGSLGEQVVIKSQRAFDRLEFITAQHVRAKAWYPRAAKRDADARRAYKCMEQETFSVHDVFIQQILQEEMTADDLRLC